MQELFNYNFDKNDARDFEALYTHKRRDSVFAFAGKRDNGSFLAIRDHLGIVPLYYRQKDGELQFSCNLLDFVDQRSELDETGLKYYLAFGTPRLSPLFKNIGIVPPGTVMRWISAEASPTIEYRYSLSPLVSTWKNDEEILAELKKRFDQAVARTLKASTVGLYLSGGLDSGLVGVSLKKNGAKVNGYTVSPWGMSGTEVKFAKMNADAIGLERHEIIPMETEKYSDYASQIPTLYGTAFGISSGLGISCLWGGSSLRDERQIYGAQAADTATCSMPQQYYTFFLSYLPEPVRRQMHANFVGRTAVQQYLNFYTHKLVGDHPWIDAYASHLSNRYQRLIAAGLYLVHTPVDGELLSAPAISQGKLFSNPFYNMDLLEFFLSIPWTRRVELSKSSKLLLTLSKKYLRNFAGETLPHELVYRKKGLTVSSKLDKYAQDFFKQLPERFHDRELKTPEMRYAAGMLERIVSS